MLSPPRPMTATRRSVLAAAWHWTGVALAAGSLMLMARMLGDGDRSRSTVLDDTRLQDPNDTPFTYAGFLISGNIERPHALDLRCTHLGCPLRFNRQHRDLRCPCHGSRFDLDGRPTVGPATRHLGSGRLSRIGRRWIIGHRP